MEGRRLNRKSTNLSVGIYWRKLLFFLTFFGMGIFAFSSISTFKADSLTSKTNIVYTPQYTSNIVINKDGSLTIDGKKAGQKIALLDDSEELRMPVIDLPATDIDEATFIVTLPKNNAADVTHEILGIHGVGETSSFIKDDHTIVYQARNISTYATVSIVAKLPKGTVTPSFSYWIMSNIPKLGGIWLAIGLSLPLATFIIMAIIILLRLRAQKAQTPKDASDAPPMAIPPGVVGVLFHQKVGAREIAATLIDLAERGDIMILDRARGFGFAKNHLDSRLLSYEKILLSKIFKHNLVSDKEEIDRRINAHLYSKKISVLSLGIYNLATRLGFYKTNPQAIYLRYKVVGTLISTIGLVGFFYSLSKYANTSYLAFLWLGIVVSALIVSWMVQKIPVRTELGQEAYDNWLAFKKYLQDEKKVPFSPDNQEIFQRYLPYAVVLECEIEWAKRFSEHNFVMPDWFVTDKEGLGLEDFCLSLFPIVSYVSRSFAAIREPGFR